MRKLMILSLMVAVAFIFNQAGWAQNIGTGFTYQGQLSSGGSPTNGQYDFEFMLFEDAGGIDQVGGTVVKEEVGVYDGYFTVALDFGAVFNGTKRWLEIGVRPGELADPNGYTPLAPRQELTPTPYALYAKMAGSVSGGTGIHGSGTLNYIPKFFASKTLVNSVIFDAGGNIGIDTTTPTSKLDVGGDINVSAGSVYNIGANRVLSVSDTENISLGIGAGKNNTGNYGTFLGSNAGYNNKGNNSTFLGNRAGIVNSGSANTFVGGSAGASNETGYYNTFLGTYSGGINVIGSRNTFLGHMSGMLNTGGYWNTFTGYNTGSDNTIGNYNTFVGTDTGHSNTEGNSNTFLGTFAGSSNLTGNNNVFLGYAAGYNETGSNKLYIANGQNDSDVLIYGDFSTGNVGIGTTSPAAPLDVSGDINTSTHYEIGSQTVLSNSGTANILVGVGAGANNTGNNVTMLGYEAGYNNQSYNNTFIGYHAGNSNTTGGSNTFVGYKAGQSNVIQGGNTFLGSDAGYFNVASFNTFLGSRAGWYNSTGVSNTFVGEQAGRANTSGKCNTFLGTATGAQNQTGMYNVFIGYLAGFGETGSQKLYIANGVNDIDVLIYGDFSSRKVGIGGIVTPFNALDVEGAMAVGASYSGATAAPANGMIIEGGVGIGTNSPNEQLHVKDEGWLQAIFESTNSSGGIQLMGRDGNGKLQSQYELQATNAGKLLFFDRLDNRYSLTIDTIGRVGIGTGSPVTNLTVPGLDSTSSFNYLKYNTANGAIYYYSSSKKYKEDIQPLKEDFTKILKVRPKSFIDKTSGERNIGYIAEDFDELGLNHLVNYRNGQPDALKYELISLYLLEVIKEPLEAINQLKKENEQLKTEYQSLQQRIEALENNMATLMQSPQEDR